MQEELEGGVWIAHPIDARQRATFAMFRRSATPSPFELESPSLMNDGADVRPTAGERRRRSGAARYDGEEMNGRGGAKYDDEDDGGGKGGGVPLLGRMRFWRRRGRSSTMEAAVAPIAAVDAVQLMAQYLRQEASNVGSTAKMPAMVLVGVADERRTLARRA